MIFLLDDDAAVRDSMQILVESVQAFETAAAITEALEAARLVPDCIILDVHLPDGDGRILCNRLSSERANVPVILMSGKNGGSMAAEATRAGAIAFFNKPIHHRDLFDTLARATAA